VNKNTTRQEYTRLFSQHSSAVMRYALRRWNDLEGCEDVVVDTFTVAWRKWDEKSDEERELPWLYGIAFRVLSNHRRSRDRRDRLLTRISMERGSQNDEDDGVDITSIQAAMGQLNQSDRELLQLVYWEELTYREIALTLGASENAVGIRITRAKSKLRGFLSLPSGGLDGEGARDTGVES
jgi:RNA polymerase sigma-70 factor (ECF subfamily)